MSTRREFLAHASAAAAGAALAHALPLSAQNGKTSPAWRLLDSFVNRRLQELNAPGLTLVLANRQGTVRVGTYGLADVTARRPVRPNDLFQIGSISKSFAANCALQLRDEGKVDLQRPVREYLPWLEIDSAVPITLHHLLSHTSGLPDDVPLFPKSPFPRLWSGYVPGSHYSYCNTGYELIGMVLEAVEKQSWSEVVRRRVLGPLGMSSTQPVITDAIRPQTAVGYAPYYQDRPFPPQRRLTRAPWVEFDRASGSISSTPADMGRYLTMLLNHGQGPHGRLISEESFRLQTTGVQQAPSWGEGAMYGYGFAVDTKDNRTLIRHTGGMVAFSSALHADLTGGVGAFASVNANLTNYRPNDVVHYALDLMRAQAAGTELPPVPPPDLPHVINNAAEYVGTYNGSGAAAGSFTVRAAGTSLMLSRAETVRKLIRIDGDRFATDEDGRRYPVQFRRDGGKVVEAFVGPDWFTHERYSGPRQFDYPREWDNYTGHYHNDDPWWGSIRIFLHKGQLWLENSDPLVPLDKGVFRVGMEEWSPERAAFDAFASGRPLRFNFSGVDFNRIETL